MAVAGVAVAVAVMAAAAVAAVMAAAAVGTRHAVSVRRRPPFHPRPAAPAG